MSNATAYYVTVIAAPGDVRGKTFIVESYLSRYDDSPAHRKVIEDAWREQHGQKIDRAREAVAQRRIT